MHIATATLESVSPYSQSRNYMEKRDQKETADDFEKRMWREHVHATESGQLFIPPMAFKNCLSDAAKYLAMQIPGKGKSTYTKHFEAGILCVEPLLLPEYKDTIKGEWLFLPSDGKRGGTKRVNKCYPIVHSWSGDAVFHVLDDTITEQVFRFHLEQAGSFIGIGRFRPRNNGYYGRFKVTKVVWK